MRKYALPFYILAFVVAALLSGVTYRFADWTRAVSGCSRHIEPDTFMAYCESPYYGDYEHGAYYFNLEPRAVSSLKSADVIILGNSRAQFAFSTDTARRYFQAQDIRHYVLGFGYAETNKFAELLIARLSLRPKFLIIVSDPFFNDKPSQVAARFNEASDPGNLAKFVSVAIDYLQKKLFNSTHAALCQYAAWVCRPLVKSIYRHEVDGSWIWRDVYAPAEHLQMPLRQGSSYSMTDQAIAAASTIASISNVRHECILLTVVPNSNIDAEAFAAQLSKHMNFSAAFPKLPDLKTIDDAHLTWSSANRWSEAFLSEIDNLIRKCVKP